MSFHIRPPSSDWINVVKLRTLGLTRRPDHESLFMERYAWLRGRALQIAEHNEQLAEDLVHDAFIQFTVGLPDLGAIRNLDAYLSGMLHKMYLSHVRRASRIRYFSSFLVDYDTVEIGLKARDLGEQVWVRDELRQICEYALVRKESSKAGSVLLLRFFLGYFPTEIAALMRNSRSAVDDWLRIARREVKLFLVDPSSFPQNGAGRKLNVGAFASGIPEYQFLNVLRCAIFEVGCQECFSSRELAGSYRSAGFRIIDGKSLAHIVSCWCCLDTANHLLGIPSLSERYPVDFLSQAAREKDRKRG